MRLKDAGILAICSLFLNSACKTRPDASRRYETGDPTKVYKLRLDPPVGSKYHYDISNESELQMEVMDKKVDNVNKSTVGVFYIIEKDSTGNLLLNTVYEKIHFHSKNGDTETDLDTDHGGGSGDPVEELLGVLKNDTITAVVSPLGETKSIRGYEELKEKLLYKISPGDTYLRSAAEKQLDTRIKDGLIKKNTQQFLNIFPDSAVHVGDRWKLSTVQQDLLKLRINSSFQLKEIRDGVAVITSQGEVTSDGASGNISGYDYTADLKGQQEGQFEVETSTGMVLNSSISSDVEGQLTMMGRQIPVKLHAMIKVEGRKVK